MTPRTSRRTLLRLITTVTGCSTAAASELIAVLQGRGLHLIDRPYTFYWRHGRREVHHGPTAYEALRRAGHGVQSLRDLETWLAGDRDKEPDPFQWNK